MANPETRITVLLYVHVRYADNRVAKKSHEERNETKGTYSKEIRR
jgi:hypothetical protein